MAFKIKTLLSLVFLSFLLMTSAWADDPFLSDNPETLAPNEQYLVFYSFYNQYRFGKYLQTPGIEFDFGVIPNMEVDTYTTVLNAYDVESFPRMIPDMNNRSSHRLPNATGFGDMDIELKYRFIQETAKIPQVAFGPNFFLPTGDYNRGLGNGRFSWYPALSAQKTIGKWLLYVATGYVINGAPALNNYLFAGFVAQNQISDQLALGLELFTQGRSGQFIAPATFLTLGTQYEVEKKCTLFFSLGHSIVGEKLLLTYLGIGWG